MYFLHNARACKFLVDKHIAIQMPPEIFFEEKIVKQEINY